jgi:hypothetical protein
LGLGVERRESKERLMREGKEEQTEEREGFK